MVRYRTCDRDIVWDRDMVWDKVRNWIGLMIVIWIVKVLG